MPQEPQPAVGEPSTSQDSPSGEDSPPSRDLDSFFIGPHGLRAGWSVLLFAGLYYLFREVVGTLFYAAGLIHDTPPDSAPGVLVGEFVPLLALVGAGLVMMLIEDRRILSYNVGGTHRVRHSLSGFAAGFAALSLLIGAMDCGGWLRLTPGAMPAAQAIGMGAIWAAAFLIVALVEEGLFRCYALSTIARGINFWWALAAEAAICLYVALDTGRQGAVGVYITAALGFFPCLILHQKAAARSAFWQAAWVTSTFFGFYHTLNSGENWIGILTASLIGFVFCVSVFVTGSAWWAIGCHAAWDWAETYFYGTADSGMVGQGRLLSADPVGNPLWSGGTDGPEGSLLVLGAIVLLLLLLAGLYLRRKSESFTAALSVD